MLAILSPVGCKCSVMMTSTTQCDDRLATPCPRSPAVANNCLLPPGSGGYGAEQSGGRGAHVCSHGVSRAARAPSLPSLGIYFYVPQALCSRQAGSAIHLSVAESRHVAAGLGPKQSGALSRHNPRYVADGWHGRQRHHSLGRLNHPSSSSPLCCALAP